MKNFRNFLTSIKSFLSDNIFPYLLTVLWMIGAIIGIILIWTFLLAFPVKWLWNWIMPDIFNFVRITYWQAWGILLLSSLILKGGGNSSNSKEEPKNDPYDFFSKQF